MSKEPLVSVIVPVYNAEKFLNRCITSILSQTYKNLELLLIDDGSTDNSYALCMRFAQNDKRIRVLHQKNGGVASARNLGLDQCKGDFITFVDADDYLSDEECYTTAMHTALLKGSDIIVWLWQYENKAGKVYSVKSEEIPSEFSDISNGVEFSKLLYKGNYANGLVVCCCNKIYKKECIAGEKFKHQKFEDDDWIGKVLSKNPSVICIPQCFYVYVENLSSISHQDFSENDVEFLNILLERQNLFSDAYIVKCTQLLFCNMYIEYYFKAKAENISFPFQKKVFCKTVRKLQKKKQIDLKTNLRFCLFYISAKLYKLLLLS